MAEKNIVVRCGEGNRQTPIRSSRYFEQQGYWYFRTREGMDIGPFDTYHSAQEGVRGFVGFLMEAKDDVVTRITKYVKLQPRKDEKTSDITTDFMPQRTDRLFFQGGYWYFRTREGMDIGPFDNRGEAAVGVRGFIDFLEGSQPEVVHRVTCYISAAS
jgi:hypothetical protein